MWAALSAQTLMAQPLTNGVGLAYFAPENQLFYKMCFPDGKCREFKRSLDDLTLLTDDHGWRARIGRGGKIKITGGSRAGKETYVFEDGRIVYCATPGETNSFAYSQERIPTEDVVPPFHFGSRQEAALYGKARPKAPNSVETLLKGKWEKSARLNWPFTNPNENGFLYASLALLSLYLTVFRRRVLTIVGLVLFAAFCVPLVMTASRGSFLALAVGLIPSAVVHFRTLIRSRMTYVMAAFVILFASVWFATHGMRLLTRGFSGSSSWSNEVRLEMWKTALPMMVDAPDGWGMNAGRAYVDWYESFEYFTATGSLINDHLSKLVRMSWFMRGLYVFGWFSLGIGLFLFAFKTKNAVPAGMVAASAVGAWFNPLMINRWLWVVPLASLLPVVVLEKPWRQWKVWAVAAGSSACASLAVLMTIMYIGERAKRPYGLAVYADGPRVSVRSRSPSVWVVDDGLSLGSAYSCKELRAGLAHRPDAGGVGYVRSFANLPKTKYRRLVLGGEAGDEWLRAISTDASLRACLPSEVVFISPPFPPSAIPPALFEFARIKYVTGEFNARYYREFDDPPPFVEIVTGMELYISDWVGYVTDDLTQKENK